MKFWGFTVPVTTNQLIQYQVQQKWGAGEILAGPADKILGVFRKNFGKSPIEIQLVKARLPRSPDDLLEQHLPKGSQ